MDSMMAMRKTYRRARHLVRRRSRDCSAVGRELPERQTRIGQCNKVADLARPYKQERGAVVGSFAATILILTLPNA